MALIECPGCGAQISDKALACPKCSWESKTDNSLLTKEAPKVEKITEGMSQENKRDSEPTRITTGKKILPTLKPQSPSSYLSSLVHFSCS